MFRRTLLLLVLPALLWICLMIAGPLFFLQFIEKKYSLALKGKKTFSLIQPKAKIKNAAFVWEGKVELRDGDFEVEIDPILWLRSGIWSMRLKGDGARLRFLGDWLKKTGVSEVQTTRLRLALSFSNDGIQDIDTVDLVSPNYQLQIHSRLAGDDNLRRGLEKPDAA